MPRILQTLNSGARAFFVAKCHDSDGKRSPPTVLQHRHSARISSLQTHVTGLDFFSIGAESVLCDWVHGSNLAHGILLCGQALLQGGAALGNLGDGVGFFASSDAHSLRAVTPPCLPGGQVAGKAFPIADGRPVNNFVFLRQLLSDDRLFQLRLPSDWMFAAATCLEAVHRLVAPVWVFEPLLTRAEVCKVGYTHYFSMEGAPRQRLGYAPRISPDEGMARVRAVFAPQLNSAWERRRRLLSSVAMWLLVFALVAMLLSWA
jgi:hypothetical protein